MLLSTLRLPVSEKLCSLPLHMPSTMMFGYFREKHGDTELPGTQSKHLSTQSLQLLCSQVSKEYEGVNLV